VSVLRELPVALLRDTVRGLLIEANYIIPDDILESLRRAVTREESPLGRRTLEQLVENYEVAAREGVPVCQDSGLTVVHLETGQDVHWVGGTIRDAINEGIRSGTRDGYLRWSMTADALLRKGATAYDLGALHVDIVAGSGVRLTVASKGFGAENMSQLKMLIPADGVAGVKRFVVDTVAAAGANACPPVIVGVGVGGTFDVSAWLAKKAVLRRLDRPNPVEHLQRLEAELLSEVNALGIGPQGLGGVVTALGVNIEVGPTHIAGLPVAVNLGCHSTRRKTVEL
jgi:fumarate hydratase subunit alpha